MQEDLKEILISFFTQSGTGNLAKKNYPTHYSDLKLEPGFGFGNAAKISWITFLGPGQTPQEGIFPAFYFFKQHNRLILAYGISEKYNPKKSWLAPLHSKTVEQYFREFGIKPYKYGSSYVYTVYSTFKDLDYERIELDLKNLIAHYKKLFQPK